MLAKNLKLITSGSFQLNPKSYEMYASNPTFPVEFSSRQEFLNILSWLIWAKRILLSEVCGSLENWEFLEHQNLTDRTDMHAGNCRRNNKSPDM